MRSLEVKISRIIISRIIKHHFPVEMSCVYLEVWGNRLWRWVEGRGRLMIMDYRSLRVRGGGHRNQTRMGYGTEHKINDPAIAKWT